MVQHTPSIASAHQQQAQSKSKPKPVPAPAPVPAPVPVPVSKSKPNSKKPVLAPVPESEPEPAPAPDTEPESEPDPEPESKSEPEPESKSEPEPEPESKSVPRGRAPEGPDGEPMEWDVAKACWCWLPKGAKTGANPESDPESKSDPDLESKKRPRGRAPNGPDGEPMEWDVAKACWQPAATKTGAKTGANLKLSKGKAKVKMEEVREEEKLFANTLERGIKKKEPVQAYSDINEQKPKDQEALELSLKALEDNFLRDPFYEHEIYFKGLFKYPGQPGKHVAKVKIIMVEIMLGTGKKGKNIYTYLTVWEDNSPAKTCHCEKDAFIKSVLEWLPLN